MPLNCSEVLLSAAKNCDVGPAVTESASDLLATREKSVHP